MSGGFYKYRCKYFYSHNCQNWVWVNKVPCATCLAEGRDDVAASDAISIMSRDISVPRVQNGILQYTLMEFVAPTGPGEYWRLKDKAARPPPALPVSSAMPALPGLVSIGHEDFQMPPHS